MKSAGEERVPPVPIRHEGHHVVVGFSNNAAQDTPPATENAGWTQAECHRWNRSIAGGSVSRLEKTAKATTNPAAPPNGRRPSPPPHPDQQGKRKCSWNPEQVGRGVCIDVRARGSISTRPKSCRNFARTTVQTSPSDRTSRTVDSRFPSRRRGISALSDCDPRGVGRGGAELGAADDLSGPRVSPRRCISRSRTVRIGGCKRSAETRWRQRRSRCAR